MASDPEVAIIGAGAAGLAAARVLLMAGMDTIVLEAKARIGGRAFTDKNSVGIAWDRGAHWLHNQGQNYFVRYAEHEGIPLEPVSETRKMWGNFGWSGDEFIKEYDAYCDLVFDRIAALGLEPCFKMAGKPAQVKLNSVKNVIAQIRGPFELAPIE